MTTAIGALFGKPLLERLRDQTGPLYYGEIGLSGLQLPLPAACPTGRIVRP
jgi:hypothetical protein